MHSLKNTVVAVGLLGLSFLFYHSSSKPGESGEGASVPTLEISEGVEGIQQLAMESIESIESNMGAAQDLAQQTKDGINSITSQFDSKLPEVASGFSSNSAGLKAPDLANAIDQTPATTANVEGVVSELVSNANQSARGIAGASAQTVNDYADQVGQKANNSFGTASSAMESAADSLKEAGQEIAGDIPSNTPYQDLANAHNGNQFNSSTKNATTNHAGDFQPGSNNTPQVQRDAGLMAALDSQNSFQMQNSFGEGNAPANSPTNEDSAFAENNSEANNNPAGSNANEFEFAAHVSGDDASFNQKATDDSSSTNANVMPVETKPDHSGVTYEAAWPLVDNLVAANDFRSALRLLTKFYGDPSLDAAQQKKLVGWLDALAGKVIFSAEHHLAAQPYVVGPGENLGIIGAKWNVPAQLVYNVNRSEIQNAQSIPAGTKLKQIQGPFEATISLNDKMLTLFVDGLYAGRYPVRVGISGEPRPGTFDVVLKSDEGHSWRDAEGKEYPPGTPENSYGPHWIGLSGSLCIHAVPQSTQHGHFGCFGLRAADAKDVFAILGKGSSVTIR